MTIKEAKAEIITKINKGISKSDLYAQFKDDINDRTLRKLLASRPSYTLKKKYKNTYILLFIIWGLFILLELLGIFDLIMSFNIKTLISLSVSLFLAFKIWDFDGRFLIPGIIWFGLSIINAYLQLDSANIGDSDYGIILIVLFVYTILLSIGIYLMYILKKNVFYYYKWNQLIQKPDENINFE